MSAENLTIRDTRGASLVLERDDNGQPSAWIAPPGGIDGPSVALGDAAVAQLADFLGLHRVEPAVDFHGDEIWLSADGDTRWLPPDHEVPDGWRRLYVEPRPGGEPE